MVLFLDEVIGHVDRKGTMAETARDEMLRWRVRIEARLERVEELAREMRETLHTVQREQNVGAQWQSKIVGIGIASMVIVSVLFQLLTLWFKINK